MNNEELTKEIQQTIDSAKKVSLSMREKTMMRERLSNYMYSSKPKVKTNYSFYNLFGHSTMYLMPALAIVLLISGAGTSYYAQNALPGEALYGFKTGVNENVESLFAISPEARAQVDLKQVSTRLDEVEKLSVAGSLTEVQSQAIQANFSKKVESLNKNLGKVKKKGDSKKIAEKVSQDFDNEIDEHYNAFITISNTASNSPTFANIFASKKGRSGVGDDVIMMSAVRVANPTSVKAKEVKKVDSKQRSDDNEDEDEDDDSDDDSRSGGVIQPVQVALPASTSTAQSAPALTSYTMLQVSSHNTSTDCWSVVSGGVYNLTSWITKHPGGQSAIKGMCGVDGTAGFLAQHNGNTKAVNTLIAYKIGILK